MDFDLIYKQYFRDVFLYLRSLSANEDIAEEIAQETFAKALSAPRVSAQEVRVNSATRNAAGIIIRKRVFLIINSSFLNVGGQLAVPGIRIISRIFPEN